MVDFGRPCLVLVFSAFSSLMTLPALGQEEVAPRVSDPRGSNPKYFKDDQWVQEHALLTELLTSYGMDHPLVVEARTRVSAIESMIDEGTTIDKPVDREIAIEMRRLNLLKLKYGDDHPMVRSVDTRLQSLRQSQSTEDSGPSESAGSIALRKELDQERNRLSELRDSYGDGHPLVQQTKNRIALLVKEQRLTRQMGRESDAHRNQIHQLALEKAHLAELRSKLGNSHPEVSKSQSKIEVLEKAIGLDAIDLEDVEELEEDPSLSAKTKDELIEARKQILEQVDALRRLRKEELTKGESDSNSKENYEKKIGELAKGMIQIDRWLLLKEIEALQQQLVAKRLQLEQERSKSEESIRSLIKEWLD